jgi:hypothetical protein
MSATVLGASCERWWSWNAWWSSPEQGPPADHPRGVPRLHLHRFGRQARGPILVGRRARRLPSQWSVSTVVSCRDPACRGDPGRSRPAADIATRSAREEATSASASRGPDLGQSAGWIPTHVSGGRRLFPVRCWPHSRPADDPARGRGAFVTRTFPHAGCRNGSRQISSGISVRRRSPPNSSTR